MITSYCKLGTLFLVLAVIGFTLVGCSHTQIAINENEKNQDEFIEGAKAIFASGEGPSFMAKGKTSYAKPDSKQSTSKADAKQPIRTKEKYMGISYWIELLTPDGKRVLTSKDRIFKTGDRIKLNVESNHDGYLYIVNIGSTGATRILFPPQNENNFIQKGKVYSVPQNIYMKFDNNPGEEILTVILSPRAIGNFDTSKFQASYTGSKDILLEEVDPGSSKDILLDETTPADFRYASPVSGAIVVPMSSLENEGDVISLNIKLKHN